MWIYFSIATNMGTKNDIVWRILIFPARVEGGRTAQSFSAVASQRLPVHASLGSNMLVVAAKAGFEQIGVRLDAGLGS